MAGHAAWPGEIPTGVLWHDVAHGPVQTHKDRGAKLARPDDLLSSLQGGHEVELGQLKEEALKRGLLDHAGIELLESWPATCAPSGPTLPCAWRLLHKLAVQFADAPALSMVSKADPPLRHGTRSTSA